MQRQQAIAHAPRSRAASQSLIAINTCVGCRDCSGLCLALIETLTLPDAVLKDKAP